MNRKKNKSQENNVKYKIISQTFTQNPPVFKFEKISTNENFDLDAAEIFNLGYIYHFSPIEIVMITYSHAEQQFMKELSFYQFKDTKKIN